MGGNIICHISSARAVIPRIDKPFVSLGIPFSVSSDNGPMFNSQDFRDLGFRHERKTTLNLEANVEAEQFIRVLKKL